MKAYSKSLLEQLQRQLECIHSETSDPLYYSEQAINILISILEQLRTFFIKYKFGSKHEEIEFFKTIKPQFVAKLIYYNEIYNIETNKPHGNEKAIKKYLNLELEKLKCFFDENIDFYRYHRTGNIYLDDKYYLRGQHDIRLTLDSFYFLADLRFSTSHDFKLAKIMANDLIQLYIEDQLAKLPGRKFQKNIPENGYKWTGSKVSLIELIYALHTEAVFNNGTSDLKDIATFFEKAFNIDLGQYHRVFLEIRARKSERTKFLNSMRDKLIKKMDAADEV